MTEPVSKTRQAAEAAFARTQTQFLARQRAFDDLDSITSARDEKTRRLRAARLEKMRTDALSTDALSLAPGSSPKRP